MRGANAVKRQKDSENPGGARRSTVCLVLMATMVTATLALARESDGVERMLALVHGAGIRGERAVLRNARKRNPHQSPLEEV